MLRWDTVPAGEPVVAREVRQWSCGVQGGWGRTWAGGLDGAMSLERWLPGMPASGYAAAQWEWSSQRGSSRKAGLGFIGVRLEGQQWGMPASLDQLSDSAVGFVRVPGGGLQQVTRIRYPIGVETDTLAVDWVRRWEGRWRLEGGWVKPLSRGFSWSLACGVSGVLQPQPRWWIREPGWEGEPWRVEAGPANLAFSGGLGLQWRQVDVRPSRKGLRPGWGASAGFHAASDGTWWVGVGALYRMPLRRKSG